MKVLILRGISDHGTRSTKPSIIRTWVEDSNIPIRGNAKIFGHTVPIGKATISPRKSILCCGVRTWVRVVSPDCRIPFRNRYIVSKEVTRIAKRYRDRIGEFSVFGYNPTTPLFNLAMLLSCSCVPNGSLFRSNSSSFSGRICPTGSDALDCWDRPRRSRSSWGTLLLGLPLLCLPASVRVSRTHPLSHIVLNLRIAETLASVRAAAIMAIKVNTSKWIISDIRIKIERLRVVHLRIR